MLLPVYERSVLMDAIKITSNAQEMPVDYEENTCGFVINAGK